MLSTESLSPNGKSPADRPKVLVVCDPVQRLGRPDAELDTFAIRGRRVEPGERVLLDEGLAQELIARGLVRVAETGDEDPAAQDLAEGTAGSV